jgi:hypothetical protein
VTFRGDSLKISPPALRARVPEAALAPFPP